MAETLISPGVLARENDQSLVTAQPLTRGAAIIGPTVKGPVERPIYVSSFSSFQAIFGGALESGSTDYTYLTSISANNYFQQGGDSLLVTRVTSGSFSSADSTSIPNLIPSATNGLEGNLLPIFTLGGAEGGTAGTFNNIGLTGSVSNSSSSLATIVRSNSNGEFVDDSQTIIPTGTLSGGNVSVSSAAITLSDANSTTSGGGTGLEVILRTSAAGNLDLLTASTTNTGSGFVVGSTISITADNINNNIADATIGTSFSGGPAVFTVTQANLKIQITAATVTTDGEGYTSGENITIPANAMGAPTSGATFGPISDTNLQNENAFVLETISEGVIMNNTSPVGADDGGTELAGGALFSGSADNIRWEVTAVNTGSGVFSLGIRRGNDNNNQRVFLETYNNISLDPFSPNYITRAIGDLSSTLITEGGDTFLQESGSYPNISNYVRVKKVNFNTPHYFNNDGTPKNEYTASLPVIGSGSFDGAVGSNINATSANNFYENINASNTQGLVGTDYTNAIALLANQDDYQYNVITAPGLYFSGYGTQCNAIKNNTISRGDSIYILDLVSYNVLIGNVTQNAAAIDSSYAAAYWPWLQTIDPSTGLLVFVPASVMIPGVYAFTDASADPWFAPAGITRGGLGAVVRAERKLTAANRDTLYEANVNPIASFPQQGVVVFGQKTLQKAATALDRVNVRRLLITLKGYISQIADNLVFEQNTIATRQNFLTQVNPYLESVQQRQGLYAFKVVMDETNNTPDVIDRNELIGQIFLQPTKTAEFIILDFNVLPTGATFPA